MTALISGFRNNFVQIAQRERAFLVLLTIAFLVAGATYQTPHIAMWVGFAFAGYSAVANDSIQTIGPFLASNRHRPWWILWLFVGGLFLATVTWSWVNYNGDVSFGRLATKGFEVAPTRFHFLSVAAPLFLMILTRLRMPVSTTFLLLSSFATRGDGVWHMVAKSVTGYGIAFVVSAVVWLSLGPWMKKRFVGPVHPLWHLAQWLATGALWSVWLMQDAANVAVYLPRSLSGLEFAAFAGVFFVGLGLLFRMGGERIQEVVEEKADVVDVRPATIISLVYALILFVFMRVSQVPMSTTWVFVGLLAGRELSMAWRSASQNGRGLREAGRLALRDLVYVTVGFLMALILAGAINPVIGESLFGQ